MVAAELKRELIKLME